jgi:hypothetical protein
MCEKHRGAHGEHKIADDIHYAALPCLIVLAQRMLSFAIMTQRRALLTQPLLKLTRALFNHLSAQRMCE